MDHILKIPSEGFIRGPYLYGPYLFILGMTDFEESLRLKIGKKTMLNFCWEKSLLFLYNAHTYCTHSACDTAPHRVAEHGIIYCTH